MGVDLGRHVHQPARHPVSGPFRPAAFRVRSRKARSYPP
jgi:hypothetical protein